MGKTPGCEHAVFFHVQKGLQHGAGKWAVEEVVGKCDQRNDVVNGDEDDGMCQSATMLEGKISEYSGVQQRVAQ